MFANVHMLLQLFTRHYGSISGILSNKKLINLPLCCKTTMQIYCWLTDCTGSSPKNHLPLCKFQKYSVCYKFLIFIPFRFSLQLFLSRLPSDIEQWTCRKNRGILHRPAKRPEQKPVLCSRKPVLPLCCYGKVLNLKMKQQEIRKKTLDYNNNLHTVKMPRKCVVMPTTDIEQLIGNHRQRKYEIAATLVFVCTGHWNL